MPEDKDNHSINALEWICMELPADPHNLTTGVYGANGQKIKHFADMPIQEIDPGHFALMDEEAFQEPSVALFTF